MKSLHLVTAIPATNPLDVDDVLRRIEESVHVHRFLDVHGAPRRDGDRALSVAERCREIGRRLSHRGRTGT